MQSSSGSKMISAAEARKLSEEYQKQNELYLRDVFEQIRAKIKLGLKELVLYNRILSADEKECLQTNGYSITEHISYRSDNNYYIDSDGQSKYPPKLIQITTLYKIRW